MSASFKPGTGAHHRVLALLEHRVVEVDLGTTDLRSDVDDSRRRPRFERIEQGIEFE